MKKDEILLYFNGDSFVAGSELADRIIFPNYWKEPGLRPPPRDELEKNFRVVDKLKEAFSDKLYYSYLEKDLSFSGQLKKATGITTVNSALGGASLNRISRTTVEDLISLKSQGKKIVAFIGTTDPSRDEVVTPAPLEITLPLDEYYSTINYGVYREAFKNFDKAYVKHKLLYERDGHRLINLLKNFIFIKDFCQVNNIDVYFMNTWYIDLSQFTSVIEKEPKLKSMFEYLNLDFIFNMGDIANTVDKNRFCPCGHFSEEVHTKVSYFLKDFITTRYLNG